MMLLLLYQLIRGRMPGYLGRRADRWIANCFGDLAAAAAFASALQPLRERSRCTIPCSDKALATSCELSCSFFAPPQRHSAQPGCAVTRDLGSSSTLLGCNRRARLKSELPSDGGWLIGRLRIPLRCSAPQSGPSASASSTRYLSGCNHPLRTTST